MTSAARRAVPPMVAREPDFMMRPGRLLASCFGQSPIVECSRVSAKGEKVVLVPTDSGWILVDGIPSGKNHTNVFARRHSAGD